jgi:prepilin-type processing-associated H-X9-DG protein
MLDDDTNVFGWGVAILPFMEQGPIYNKIDGIMQATLPNTAITQVKPIMLLQTNIRHPNIDAWGATPSTAQGEQPWRVDKPANRPFTQTFLPVFFCPSNALPRFDDDRYATSTYCGNVGNQRVNWDTGANAVNWSVCAGVRAVNQNGFFNHDNNNNDTICNDMASILDGTSNTLMIGEVGQTRNVAHNIVNNANFPVWAGGNNDGGCQGRMMGSHLRFAGGLLNANGTVTTNLEYFINNKGTVPAASGNPHRSDLTFGSYHPGGAQFAMGDGSVRFVPQTVNYAVYSAMGGRNDNIPLQAP